MTTYERCEYCDKKLKARGMAPHVAMHQRQGHIKKNDLVQTQNISDQEDEKAEGQLQCQNRRYP